MRRATGGCASRRRSEAIFEPRSLDLCTPKPGLPLARGSADGGPRGDSRTTWAAAGLRGSVRRSPAPRCRRGAKARFSLVSRGRAHRRDDVARGAPPSEVRACAGRIVESAPPRRPARPRRRGRGPCVRSGGRRARCARPARGRLDHTAVERDRDRGRLVRRPLRRIGRRFVRDAHRPPRADRSRPRLAQEPVRGASSSDRDPRRELDRERVLRDRVRRIALRVARRPRGRSASRARQLDDVPLEEPPRAARVRGTTAVRARRVLRDPPLRDAPTGRRERTELAHQAVGEAGRERAVSGRQRGRRRPSRTARARLSRRTSGSSIRRTSRSSTRNPRSIEPRTTSFAIAGSSSEFRSSSAPPRAPSCSARRTRS